MKKCCRCKKIKDLTDFSNLKASPDGLRYDCRECVSERYYENHEANREINRRSILKYRYGITPEDYDALLEKQLGMCAICRNGFVQRLDIDHCHETGKIRGLLCNNCNRGIGHLQEDLDILTKAIEYLKEHENE